MTEEVNRYRPPASNVAEAEAARPTALAGKGRRLGAVMVDYVCFMALSFCIGVATVLLFGRGGMQAVQKIPELLLNCIIMALFYIFFEGIWARTPGKFLFGIVVVDEGGRKPSIGQVVIRTFCRFLPFEVFSCLGEQGWHDSIPKTRVVLAKVR